MYLIDSVVGLFSLRWTQTPPQLHPLPAHVKRVYVPTPNGDLELLVCEPKPTNPSQSSARQPPIFFAHGGYGSAGVWLDWMTYLHNRGYTGTLYSCSLRNHGASYTVPYFRMVYKVTFEEIQADMLACLKHVDQKQRQKQAPGQNATTMRPPILVGHSSGGGLAQALLTGHSRSENNEPLRTTASGLCLLDSITSFGSYDLYWNWFLQDPWFPLRIILHLQHPTSPLSTDRLIHGIFFGHKFPMAAVGEFRRWMPGYECTGWPKGMLGGDLWGWMRGEQNVWLDCKDILAGISGAERDDWRDKVCVMVGREDKMYQPWMWERQTAEYVRALGEVRKDGSVGKGGEVSRADGEEEENEIPNVTVTRTGGVRTVIVDDAGHHVQNEVDELKYGAAEALLRFANQV